MSLRPSGILGPEPSFLVEADLQRASTRCYQPIGAYEPGYEPPPAAIWPRYYTLDQGSLPSCVGQAYADCVHSLVPGVPRASAVGIWRTARSYHGRAEEITGTYLHWGAEALERRGWEDYRHGEESLATSRPSLEDELQAHDRRQVRAERRRIVEPGVAAIQEAVAQGLGVVGAWGISPWFDAITTSSARSPVGEMMVSERDRGHAMRIVGYWSLADGERRWLVGNSWGHEWGGANTPWGFYPGCWVADDSAIRARWTAHAIRFVS